MSDTESSTDRTVFKAASGNGSSKLMIHRNRDCWRLDCAKTVLEKDESIYPDWIDRCPDCWGESHDR